jgi:FAD dependent oxidoreductase TIGR03364
MVFERGVRARGASARNFGTLWPVGQPSGPRRALALESLAIWRDILKDSGLWNRPDGSLHLAYHADELAVLSEFAGHAADDGFPCDLLPPDAVISRSPMVRADGLLGALWSRHEVQVNPRLIVDRLPRWLSERFGVEFHHGVVATAWSGGRVHAGVRHWPADRLWVATGDDLQTLYPDALGLLGLRRCKLQMMRTAPVDWTLGSSLVAGLTLAHYDSFRECESLPVLTTRLERDWPEQRRYGVHVIVAQHEAGHLLLGDTHEYDDEIEPFDKPHLDALVLDYLRTFLVPTDLHVIERWHGVYVKHPDQPYCVLDPEPGVTAVVGLGGHGMTMSFGLARRVVRDRLD